MMGVLTRRELASRIAAGELVYPARLVDGHVDLEGDSYDLSAGKAVWKAASDGQIQSVLYLDGVERELQATVTVQPGQMIFVVTREEVVLPSDLCGTVYSRNSLARDGILALNAGHVDPGYRGQIMIRLINLRATQWPLTMGAPIFTIVFQTVDRKLGDTVPSRTITRDQMDDVVKRTAGQSMSNALLDIYTQDIARQLNEHYTQVEQKLHSSLTRNFVSRENLLPTFASAVWKWAVGLIAFTALIVGLVTKVLPYLGVP
jgi:deoxycytidine triphosphate deaminase